MKGISCGAVDYLLEPVTIEELQDLWLKKFKKQEILDHDINESQREFINWMAQIVGNVLVTGPPRVLGD